MDRVSKAEREIVRKMMTKTNYDLLISKTPEELAEWLSDVAGWLSAYEGKVHPILKWLKSPASEVSDG